jgi:hypothetical protein
MLLPYVFKAPLNVVEEISKYIARLINSNMATPSSRDGLIQYCLRRLGHPVIEINVDPDQVEDRIDDALQQYQQFHMDATEHVVVPYQVTDTDMINKFLPVPKDIISVVGFVPLGNDTRGLGMFDIEYQMRLTDWDAFYAGGSIMNYDVMQQHLALLRFEFDVAFSFDFNRHQGKLFIRWNWGADVLAGDFMIMEGYRILDPDTYPDVYNDFWLKRYATELIRRTWSENLLKYSGTTLPGGITLNGPEMYQRALDSIEKLEQELRDTYELPISFMIG